VGIIGDAGGVVVAVAVWLSPAVSGGVGVGDAIAAEVGIADGEGAGGVDDAGSVGGTVAVVALCLVGMSALALPPEYCMLG
jgi:hypothetical protein